MRQTSGGENAMTSNPHIDIIPCPRCIGGNMFYDMNLHEYNCVQCGYSRQMDNKYFRQSILHSNGIPQANFPSFVTSPNANRLNIK